MGSDLGNLVGNTSTEDLSPLMTAIEAPQRIPLPIGSIVVPCWEYLIEP